MKPIESRVGLQVAEQMFVWLADKLQPGLPLRDDRLCGEQTSAIWLLVAIGVTAMRPDPVDPLSSPGGPFEICFRIALQIEEIRQILFDLRLLLSVAVDAQAGSLIGRDDEPLGR